MKQPTQRSMEYCRKEGMLAGVTERWNPHARIRQDLFGFIDLIVLDGAGAIGVQATSGPNASKRLRKIIEEPKARTWLENGQRIEIWAWRKRKLKRGGVAFRWELDVIPVTMKEIERGNPPEPPPPPDNWELFDGGRDEDPGGGQDPGTDGEDQEPRDDDGPPGRVSRQDGGGDQPIGDPGRSEKGAE